ncbi:arginine repressor [Melioribacteraceae bacterium 4301-Me]|uniref:arginine repressor n=1 Tax=Pyranulibacter aquaticus TaxID=3163344 RepID=UPI003595E3B3
MSAKLKRQNVIKEILATKVVSTHEDLIELLKKEHIYVTQATLSRDFAEMGVIRTIVGNTPKYLLNPEESGRKISKLISFEIISVEHNEALIVVRTLAGRAQGVAHYIDRLNVPEILGTVGGDDTVLVIPNSTKNLPKVVELIKEMMTDKL